MTGPAVRNSPIAKPKDPEQLSSRTRQWWIGFWWWVFMPLDLIDLKTGLPRYDRILPLVVIVFYGLKMLNETGWPPTLQMIGIFAMIFGQEMFRMFLTRAHMGKVAVDLQPDDQKASETEAVIEGSGVGNTRHAQTRRPPPKAPGEPDLFYDDESGA